MVLLACLVCSYLGVAAAGCAARASTDIWALSAVGAHQPSKHSCHYNSYSTAQTTSPAHPTDAPMATPAPSPPIPKPTAASPPTDSAISSFVCNSWCSSFVCAGMCVCVCYQRCCAAPWQSRVYRTRAGICRAACIQGLRCFFDDSSGNRCNTHFWHASSHVQLSSIMPWFLKRHGWPPAGTPPHRPPPPPRHNDNKQPTSRTITRVHTSLTDHLTDHPHLAPSELP